MNDHPASFLREGLSEDEAEKRLVREGPNELPQSQERSLPRIALDVIREPMLALLLV